MELRMTQVEAQRIARSPCINVCELDQEDGLCRGCLRTLAEISDWSRASNNERLDILVAVARRRAGIGNIDAL